MDEYKGRVLIRGCRVYTTKVDAPSAQKARTLVANEFRRFHPHFYIADILRHTSVQRVRF